jgi:hypothetical protein
MSHDQIQTLAQEIVGQSIRNSWEYWLIVAALLALATFAGGYLSRYAGKEGACGFGARGVGP